MRNQLELFEPSESKLKVIRNEEIIKLNTKKRQPQILKSFIVNSYHIMIWANVSERTAQRELRKIRVYWKIRERGFVTLCEVADYYGWRGERLLRELNGSKLSLQEDIREKI